MAHALSPNRRKVARSIEDFSTMIGEKAGPVYVVAVLYNKNYYTNLLRSLARLGALHPIEKIIVVVNNPGIDHRVLERLAQALASRIEFVAHDNTGGEFGACQTGVDLIRKDLESNSLLMVMNETPGIHYPFDREHADAFMRSLLNRAYPCRVVGHIDHFPRRVSIDDCSSSRWVRSNLVGFDFAAISSIDFRIYDPRLHAYIQETEFVDAFFSDKVDPLLQSYIADWLFSQGRWYGAAALSKGNARSLAFKARSILQEKYLSMRLDRHQVAFLAPRYTPAEQVTRRAKNGLRRVMRALGMMRPPGRT